MTYRFESHVFSQHAQAVQFRNFDEAIHTFGTWPAFQADRATSVYDAVMLTDTVSMNSPAFRTNIANHTDLMILYRKCIPHTRNAADCIELAKEAWGKRLYFGHEMQPAIVHAMRTFRNSVPCLAELYYYAREHLHDPAIEDWAVERTIRAFWITIENSRSTQECLAMLTNEFLNGTLREVDRRHGGMAWSLYISTILNQAYELAGNDRESLFRYIKATRGSEGDEHRHRFDAMMQYNRLAQGECFDLAVA